MSDAPERIVAMPDDNHGWLHGHCSDALILMGEDHAEYIRADLAAPKVKPLVWIGDESGCYVYAETMIGTYEVVVSDTLDRPLDYVWSASVELCNPKSKSSIKTPPKSDFKAAKAAAKADYERRILGELE